ncbi:primase 2 [Ostertagia ostertagi]
MTDRSKEGAGYRTSVSAPNNALPAGQLEHFPSTLSAAHATQVPASHQPLASPANAAPTPAMAAARRWLVWRHEPNADPRKKQRKVPYYVDGGRREGVLDSPADVARLVSYSEALAAIQNLPGVYSGAGFALGDGWQGIDLDDVPQNQLADLANDLPGYVELSPSGNGCHAIGYGRPFAALGSNHSGVEAYARSRFFTFTGNPIRPNQPTCLADFVEQRLMPRHSMHRAVGATVSTSSADPQTVTELRSALNAIPADDREIWVRVGLACKTLGESVGYELWATWSQRSRKWEPDDAARTWDSFEPRDISHLSIFKIAQDCGWINPRSNAAQLPAAHVHQPCTWTPVSVFDVFTQPAAPVEFLIDDLLPAREVTLLPADGGAGKSLLTLIAATCLAMGLPFMGKTTMRCKVVFYSGEDDDRVLRNRLRRICEHYRVDPAELARRLLVLDTTDAPNLFCEVRDADTGPSGVPTKNLHELERVVADWGARVVIVDNASDTFDANENSRQQVRGFVRSLKSMAKRNDAAIWLLAHLDKASVRDPSGKAQFSGSTAWHNSVRSRLLLAPDIDRPEGMVLSQPKSNLGRRSTDILLTWTTDGMLEHAGVGQSKPTTPELRGAVLSLIRSRYERGQFISTSLAPNAATGAYATLSADPAYPRRLDKKALATLLQQARADGLLKTELYESPTRRGHKALHGNVQVCCTQAVRHSRHLAGEPMQPDPSTQQTEDEDTSAPPVSLHPSPLDAAFQAPKGRPSSAADLVWSKDPLTLPSVSLAPGNITGIDGYEEFGGWGLEHVVSSMAGLRDACANIIEARRSVLLDPTMTDAARAIAVADLADKLSTRATKAVDASLATLKKTIAAERAELSKPLAAAVSPELGREIRAHVKAMKPAERLGFLQAQAKAGDVTTLSAVLKTPAYLSGMEPNSLSVLNNELNRALNPGAVRRLAMLEKAEQRLSNAGSIFIASSEHAIGVKRGVVDRLREQSRRARKSLAALGAVPGWTGSEPTASDEPQTAPGKNERGHWLPGVSGNPRGRAKGSTNKRSPIEAQVAQHGEAIMQCVIEAALEGDLQAANIALQRISPALKAKASTVTFELDPDAPLEAQARQVMAAISVGELDPDTGKMLIECLHSFSALRVADELMQLEHQPPALPATVVHAVPRSEEG